MLQCVEIISEGVHLVSYLAHSTLPIEEKNNLEKCAGMGLNGFHIK